MTITEQTIARKMGTKTKGSITLTTRSTGLHTLAVNNGSNDQREASHGSTQLDNTDLLNLYRTIEAALNDPVPSVT